MKTKEEIIRKILKVWLDPEDTKDTIVFTDDIAINEISEEIGEAMQKYSDQENERLKAVVSKQDELNKLRKSYIVFIGEQLSDHAEFLRIHGISCSEKDIKTGIEYRKQIEYFESELSKLKAE